MERRNQVTPDHVGRRVTFQYELPNGYLSEVVGTLKWFDQAAQTFVVEDRDGRLVRVPAKGVRHGKLVTPR
ncbi:MAG TPA: hypothetical protein VE737_01745 [Actinomycetota bacterium]|jgi:hypothetical protein|nr:hypothetical protein [Actinomycetota bacterium]